MGWRVFGACVGLVFCGRVCVLVGLIAWVFDAGFIDAVICWYCIAFGWWWIWWFVEVGFVGLWVGWFELLSAVAVWVVVL